MERLARVVEYLTSLDNGAAEGSMGGESPSSGEFRIYAEREKGWPLDRIDTEFAEFVLRDLGLVAVDPALVDAVRKAGAEDDSDPELVRFAWDEMPDARARLMGARLALADAILAALEEP